MADPIIPLLKLQEALDNDLVDISHLEDGYMKMYDEVGNGLNRKRYSYAKIINNEVQALAIFGVEDPVDGIACYDVGYSVSEKHRGRKLSIEAVNKGLEDLKKILNQHSIKQFYLAALVAETNTPSIKIAKKIFSSSGQRSIDRYSGTRSLYFQKLIAIQ